MNPRKSLSWQKPAIYLSFILSFCLTTTKFNSVKAQSAPTPPTELIELITKIDLAANQQDLGLLSQYYTTDFKTTDDINYQTLTESLTKLWQEYPDLKYTTTIESWEEDNGQLVAITSTKIEGTLKDNDQKIKLVSYIRGKNFFDNQKIAKQEILSEKTELTSGVNPPQVIVRLPETAEKGSKFDFDVIVTEALGDNLLLGGALETEVNKELFAESATIPLDALSAGGIFKKVTVPNDSQDRLYSVILIQNNGLRLITQRVKINP